VIPATILIPARDSARTIQRAVVSAVAQDAARVLLIDDWSSDQTADMARRACPTLDVIRPVEHRTLGFARQTGLDAVTTPFAIWLDADDELLPGRTSRLVEAMTRAGTDFAADAVELVDGRAGGVLGTLSIPSFLRRDNTMGRLFERNYLPAPGSVAMRTETAQRVGYDVTLHGAEDVDFLLRGVAAGSRWSLLAEVGYRQWAYASSVSRGLDRQHDMTRRALLKHGYADVETCLRRGGWSALVTEWALISMAIFRDEYDAALDRIGTVRANSPDHEVVVEPDGPCPLPEGWRLAFHEGTLRLLAERVCEAVPLLERAEALTSQPDSSNNLGVAYARSGRWESASTCFRRALDLEPGYLDARVNLERPDTLRVTTHPLRRFAVRRDYPFTPR
jgi:glycosyltransferase involved in cell wall biosynthesis